MTDFMRWLYAHYIKPHQDDADQTGYEMPLAILDSGLMDDQKEELDRVVEFYAGNAFLLGLRTGMGLERSLHPHP